MSDEREKVLGKIKNGLRQTLLPAASPEHPGAFQGYSFQADTPVESLIEHFTAELEALSGHAHAPTSREEVIPAVLDILKSYGVRRVISWQDSHLGVPGLLQALAEAGIELAASDLPVERAGRRTRLAELDDVGAGLSGAQGGLADTGSLALISGPGQGRLASLLPPVHLALLPVSHLYPSLPAFLAAHPTATADGSNLVLITGPSRTADIEMTLSIGVHGPKEIHVVIVP